MISELKLLIIWLFGLTFLQGVAAELTKGHDYYFSHISGKDGLSHSNVKAIIKDSYGFMWFGTKNGLNRYDGISVKVIDCNDHLKGKSDHNISALFEDDNKKLWVGTDKGVFMYDPVSETFDYLDVATQDGFSISNWISDIRGDQWGNVWVMSPSAGVFRYKNNRLFHYYITDVNKYHWENPQCICVRKNGEVWIGTNHCGIYLYDEKVDSFKQILSDKEGNSFKDDNVFSICDYHDGIAIAVHEGQLKKYDVQKNLLSVIQVPQVHYSVMRDVACYDQNELWVASQKGLFVINEVKNTVDFVSESHSYSYGLSDRAVCVTYRDKDGGTWLGTLFGGVNYLPGSLFPFEKYVPTDNRENSLSSNRIRELAEDRSGKIWIGTEDGGINVLDPETGFVRSVHYDRMKNENSLNTLALWIRGDQLWCGSFKRGLTVMDISSETLSFYGSEYLQLEEGSIYALHQDKNKRVWLGTARGVYVSDGSLKFQKLQSCKFDWVADILEDKDGEIWLASLGQGLCRYDQSKERFVYYTHDKDNSQSLSSNTVNGIMQDSKGFIWLSTDRGGICRYDKKVDKFTTYSIAEGLPDDVAYKIQEDTLGLLWFGTNRGLVRFNPQNKEVKVYTKHDGLLGNQFNYKSSLKAQNGKFYFGGIDGLIAFDPMQKVINKTAPAVYITSLRIYDQELSVHQKASPLKKSILFTEEIALPYDQSTISLDFAVLSFSWPQSSEYLYMMENLDKSWIKAPENQTISYSQLPPGEYVFRIKIVNPETSWKETERTLRITIHPPWWHSSLAYFGYFIVMIGAIWIGFFFYKRHKDQQIKESQRVFEIEKEKELYSAKVEFFTEIAHEIRTPLTLINGPLETILDMNVQEPRIVQNLQVMSQNTQRLLDLTRQLLDFRKVGSNRFVMDFVIADVKQIVLETVSRFQPTIERAHKQIALSLPLLEYCYVHIDKEAFTKILSNLLNNSLKYSLCNISLELTMGEDFFSVFVISDGDKIPKELSLRIFEPFYQIHQKEGSIAGVGMGLPLSKSLAELHGGRLYLDTERVLNTFVLRLPLQQERVIRLNEENEEPFYMDEDPSACPISQAKEYTVLLVEDNLSVQSFVTEKMQDDFMVIAASNGLEAIERLQQQSVDIIVCDIMMPQMDGMTFCQNIKADIEMSHIPFIFLTAKNDLDSKVNGLKAGAEAYIEKPFSYQYLRNQITTLLDNRKKEREAFAKRPFFPVQNMKMNRADQEFMDQLIDTIHANITDENFGVERLADILCMSRSSLLRKIKVLTNLSAVDFIKLIRLKQAAELIQEGKYRIGEICFMVGFNSPSYFSKQFQSQFGVAPKEFAKQSSKN